MKNELPEDLNQWPSSPWRILGVDRATNRRDLRAAYVKLIRRFKPEHHPEHYRRIREAYEHLRERSEAIDDPADHNYDPCAAGSHPIPHVDNFPSDRGPRCDPATHPPRTVSEATPSHRESFESIWQQAYCGDTQQAYRKLITATERSSVELNVFAGLYWLLRRDRSLDSNRSPLDWIEQGLHRNARQDFLAELLIREVASGAQLDLVHWAKTFLSFDRRRSIRLLRSWCEATVGLRRWDELWAGLNEIRGSLSHEHSEEWFRLILLVLNHVSWERDEAAQKVRRACWDEVQSMTHWHLDFADQLLWFDEYPLLADAIKHVNDVGERWVSLIREAVRAGWSIEPIASREQALPEGLESFAAEVARDPVAAMRKFDTIARTPIRHAAEVARDPVAAMRKFDTTARTPIRQPNLPGGQVNYGIVLLTFLNHLFGGGEPSEPSNTSNSQARRIREFIDKIGPTKYCDLRLDLLSFCVEEVVRPSEILSVLHCSRTLNFDGTDTLISESLAGDASLRLVVQIHDFAGARVSAARG